MADSIYSAGDLNLSIRTLSANTLKSLDAVVSRLRLIESKFYRINNLAKSSGRSGGKSSKAIEYIYKGDGSPLATLPQKPSKTSKEKSSSTFGLAKLTATIYGARRLGGLVANLAQKGADFTETLNLWSVSMGKDLLPQATAFVDKMNEAYGVSKQTLMQAQATYKNMLGSLGQISEEQAYILSEGVTQMALDYASLYNQTFDQATTKFQAALAGQVRPIRSVAGYDITETTLFDVYKALGGDKSMRQLNRTEKQLLSIYAIFQQMERSGATGDLKATMESFANQSRVAKERMKDIASYSGVLLTHWLETYGVLTKLNGVLIFIAETLEAVVEATGAAKNFEREDVFDGVADSAYDASEAIDELNGKLLGFDKFRAMNDSGDSDIGIDQTLVNALSKYQSILSDAKIEATELAEQFKIASGFFNEDGTFNLDRWYKFIDVLKLVGIALGIIFGIKMVMSVVTFFTTLFKWLTPTNIAILLIVAGIAMVVMGIKKLVDGEIGKGLYYIALAIVAIGAAIAILAGGWVPLLVAAIVALVVAIVAVIVDKWGAIAGFFTNLWNSITNGFMTVWNGVATWFMRLINTISNAFITFVNWCVDALNWLLKPIDKIVEFFGGKGVEIPEWSAVVDWGGVGTFAQGGLPD